MKTYRNNWLNLRIDIRILGKYTIQASLTLTSIYKWCLKSDTPSQETGLKSALEKFRINGKDMMSFNYK